MAAHMKGAAMTAKAGYRTSTETPISSSGSQVNAPLTAARESDLRVQLFRSLTRIERYLKRRDPEALRCISAWYSAKGCAGAAAEEDGSDGRVGQKCAEKSRRRRRRRNLQQQRMEQTEIDEAVLEYIKIPKGIAKRSLLVPPMPDWIFADQPLPCPQQLLPGPPDCESVAGFRWLTDSNASNAGLSSRRLMEREMLKQRLDQWVFLYFRTQRRDWESCVVEEKKADNDVNMYAEDNIGKWTSKLRFKILRQAPVKVALNAFLNRFGLTNDATVMFCIDGFYGLMDVGNVYGDITKTPCATVSFNTTPRFMCLKNGDSIFVNSCSASQRQMMEEAPREDVAKKYRRSRLSFDLNDEGEFNYEINSEGGNVDEQSVEDL